MNTNVEDIISKQNERVKNLIKLQKSSERRSQGVFTIEGIKEIQKAASSGYRLIAAYFCPDIIDYKQVIEIVGNQKDLIFYRITRDIYNKVSYRENSGGIIVVAESKRHLLSGITVDQNPFFLVIEGIEKPGNIGAMLRTADASGVSGVLICNSSTDLYNPNAIRSSLGCVFTLPIALCSSAEAVEWLAAKGVQIVATHFQATKSYFDIDYTLPTAIVMGAEATGITGIWSEVANANVIIPMRGVTDSLNVSNATAIIIFEALRQRLTL